MKTTWIIQTNMGASSDIGNYVQAVKESGANVIEVEHLAFSNDIPQIEIEGPLVVHGAVTFIEAISKDKNLSRGVFGNPDVFTYKNWANYYNEMLLNSPDGIELTTVGEFCTDTRDPEELIFTRPQHDTKSLVGSVEPAGKFKKWCIEACEGSYVGITKDTPIVVAKPYGIEAEWRLFVVNNKVVSASQYHKKGRLHKSPGAPQDILDFAEKVIARWNPAPVYTLDLCHSAGNCYIVEAQGFNSAGHYACDMLKVANAVNEVAFDLWNKNKNKLKI